MIRLALSTADKTTLAKLHAFVNNGIEFRMPNVVCLGTGKQFVVVHVDGDIESAVPFRLEYEAAVAGDARTATPIELGNTIYERALNNFEKSEALSDYSIDSYKTPKVPVRAVVFKRDGIIEFSTHLDILRYTEVFSVWSDEKKLYAVPGFQYQQAVRTLFDIFPEESLRMQWMDLGYTAPILKISCSNVTIFIAGLIEEHAKSIAEMTELL